MARFEPFSPGRRVVAAVSGGADSMALALMLRRWGHPLAVVVDHGLRPDSADEAAQTVGRLAAIGVPARSMRLQLAPGGGLGARARDARYAALLGVCRAEGLPDLVLGHHRRDQDETVALRRARGSGLAGLAGMAAESWRTDARLLRPLLPVAPGRLRASLAEAGVGWAEDPGNHDMNTARGALRALPIAPAAPVARDEAEKAIAAELAACVTLHPCGVAVLRETLSLAALSALVWTLSGRPHPPGTAALARLARQGDGTLHGVAVQGRLLFREPAATAPDRPATCGTLWDGRFRVFGAPPGTVIGALGQDAARLRRWSPLPSAALKSLPCLRRGENLLTVPHLSYPDEGSCRSVRIVWEASRPLAGATFRA